MAPPFDVKRTGNDQGGSVPGVHTDVSGKQFAPSEHKGAWSGIRERLFHSSTEETLSQAAPRDTEDETSCGRDKNHSYPDFPTSGLGFSDFLQFCLLVLALCCVGVCLLRCSFCSVICLFCVLIVLFCLFCFVYFFVFRSLFSFVFCVGEVFFCLLCLFAVCSACLVCVCLFALSVVFFFLIFF